MKKKTSRWILFTNEFEDLPKCFVRNVKYRIEDENTESITVANKTFYKPIYNVVYGDIIID